MLECSGCHRHVRLDETSCPFCATPLVTVNAPSPARVVILALCLGLGLGCADRNTLDSGESNGEGPDTVEESTTVSDTSSTTTTTTITTLGDGDGDTSDSDDWQEEAAAYAGPDDWSEEEQEFGDGDGDSGDGDGDSDVPCAELGAEPLVVGINEVFVVDGPSLLESSCGAGGPEAVYSFVAPEDGFYDFTLSAEFEAALYLVGEVCDPLNELLCDIAPAPVSLGLTAGTGVSVVIDSFEAGGNGQLEIGF